MVLIATEDCCIPDASFLDLLVWRSVCRIQDRTFKSQGKGLLWYCFSVGPFLGTLSLRQLRYGNAVQHVP